jgi:hypothetical protein
MTSFSIREFNLEYMLYRINIQTKYFDNFAQKALDETPEIPLNEYVWYFCPLEYRVVDIQVAYYQHCEKY